MPPSAVIPPVIDAAHDRRAATGLLARVRQRLRPAHAHARAERTSRVPRAAPCASSTRSPRRRSAPARRRCRRSARRAPAARRAARTRARRRSPSGGSGVRSASLSAPACARPHLMHTRRKFGLGMPNLGDPCRARAALRPRRRSRARIRARSPSREVQLGPAARAEGVVDLRHASAAAGTGDAARRARSDKPSRSAGRRTGTSARDQEPQHERAALDPADDTPRQAEADRDDRRRPSRPSLEEHAQRPDEGDDRQDHDERAGEEQRRCGSRSAAAPRPRPAGSAQPQSCGRSTVRRTRSYLQGTRKGATRPLHARAQRRSVMRSGREPQPCPTAPLFTGQRGAGARSMLDSRLHAAAVLEVRRRYVSLRRATRMPPLSDAGEPIATDPRSLAVGMSTDSSGSRRNRRGA